MLTACKCDHEYVCVEEYVDVIIGLDLDVKVHASRCERHQY